MGFTIPLLNPIIFSSIDSIFVFIDDLRRISEFFTFPSNSSLSGTANSAAAVGVGALKSATKSINVVSVSCPMAEIMGILHLETALTTFSSLKAQRSSRLPPPLATIINSGGSIWEFVLNLSKPSKAATISLAASFP